MSLRNNVSKEVPRSKLKGNVTYDSLFNRAGNNKYYVEEEKQIPHSIAQLQRVQPIQVKLSVDENPQPGYWDRFVAFCKENRPLIAATVAGAGSGAAAGAGLGVATGWLAAIPTFGFGYIPTIIIFTLIGGAIGGVTGFVAGMIGENSCTSCVDKIPPRNIPKNEVAYEELIEPKTKNCFTAFFERKPYKAIGQVPDNIKPHTSNVSVSRDQQDTISFLTKHM